MTADQMHLMLTRVSEKAFPAISSSHAPQRRGTTKPTTKQLVRRQQPKRKDREVRKLWKVQHRGMRSAVANYNSTVDLCKFDQIAVVNQHTTVQPVRETRQA